MDGSPRTRQGALNFNRRVAKDSSERTEIGEPLLTEGVVRRSPVHGGVR
jgi:hypothetical protein